MKKKNTEIIPLSRNEMGHLVGGFSQAEDVHIASESIYNSNCGKDSGWVNINCGCQACKEAILKPPTGK